MVFKEYAKDNYYAAKFDASNYHCFRETSFTVWNYDKVN